MRRRKTFIVSAFVFLLLGLVLLSYSNMQIKHVDKDRQFIPIFVANYTWTPDELIWSKQCWLNSGDNVTLKIRAPILWGYGPYDISEEYPQIPGYIGPKLVYVDFILNDSLQTWFELWYYQYIRTGRPDMVNCSIYEGRNDCLIIEGKSPLEEIGGKVKYTGNYTIRISGPFPTVVIPPQEQAKSAPVFVELDNVLVVEQIKTTRPYSYLLIPGLTLMIFSSMLSFFYIRTNRGKSR